jgi:hypothetical protein
MSTPAERKPFAWEPLTPRGVAAFARASVGRLLLVQFVCGLVLAGTVVWFLSAGWFPAIGAAIQQLPEQGEIRSGKLNWRGRSPELLGDNRFLAVVVDLSHSGEARSPAHVQVEFGENGLSAFSLFGHTEGVYPAGWIIGFNRQELQPWWGAWRPAILAIAAAIVVVGSMFLWAILATIYFLPAWLAGFFGNRKLNFRGSWKLAGAALMPGALLFAMAILLYTWSLLDLVRLGGAAGLSLLIGWIYLVVSPLFLPKLSTTTALKGNPFATPPDKSLQ